LPVEMTTIWPPLSAVGNTAFHDSRAYSWRAYSSSNTIVAVSPWHARLVEGTEEILPSGKVNSIRVDGLAERVGFVISASNRRCSGSETNISKMRLTTLIASSSLIETTRARVPGIVRSFQSA
jgi:hypothetical protein